MKELVEKFEKEIVCYREEVLKRKEVIDALQTLCKHEDISDDGRDSHHYYSVCNICGKRFKD